MNNSKPDDIGYCVLVEADKISCVKMQVANFESPGFKPAWIAKLIGGSIELFTLETKILFEGVYKQFSDPTIDIFVDDSGILKELPETALTQKGISLYGNLVILRSDEQGETHLLTKNQVGIALDELGFYKQLKINLVDLANVQVDTPIETENEHPQELKALLEVLLCYCIDNKAQLLSRAKATNQDTEEEALIMCLHGETKFINDCHKLLREFITSNQGSISETFIYQAHESSNL